MAPKYETSWLSMRIWTSRKLKKCHQGGARASGPCRFWRLSRSSVYTPWTRLAAIERLWCELFLQLRSMYMRVTINSFIHQIRSYIYICTRIRQCCIETVYYYQSIAVRNVGPVRMKISLSEGIGVEAIA